MRSQWLKAGEESGEIGRNQVEMFRERERQRGRRRKKEGGREKEKKKKHNPAEIKGKGG